MKQLFRTSILTIAGVIICVAGFSKPNSLDGLKKKLQQIIAPLNGTVGIAIMDLESHESITINDNHLYPMLSVYKFPLAVYILDLVNREQLALDKHIHVNKEMVDPNTYSPLAKKFPNQDFDISLSTLLQYSVSKSDNNACDLLFEIAGGPRIVNNYIHSIGVQNISIAATEAQMKEGWRVPYTNWCQPSAMLELLRRLHEGTLLPARWNNVLLQLMTESENSAARLKGKLPKDAVVAHKTGTSNKNASGLIAATNDVGIVTLPNGRHFAIAVFVSDYMGDYPKGEQTIATIARCTWDHFLAGE